MHPGFVEKQGSALRNDIRSELLPSQPDWQDAGPPLPVVAGFVVGFVAQIYRYARVSGPAQRQQSKWVVFGFFVVVAGFVAAFLLGSLYPVDAPTGGPWLISAVNDFILTVTGLAVPITLGIAILEYQLFDVDVVIRRTLVYGALTATLVIMYFVSVVALQRLFQGATGQQSDLAIVGSTLTIAALFQPLRHRIQAFIDRRFYRQRYDSARVLAAFGAPHATRSTWPISRTS